MFVILNNYDSSIFSFRNVSQECADAILAMVQNCSLMLSKGTLSRLPPPVLRHRAMESFNPALSGQVLFNIILINQMIFGNLH
jgi:hypothetical protein